MTTTGSGFVTLVDVLHMAGWLLTILGQVEITWKARQGFITWIVANAVLVALSAHVGLWWFAGMYVTNIGVCLWSFRQWGKTA